MVHVYATDMCSESVGKFMVPWRIAMCGYIARVVYRGEKQEGETGGQELMAKSKCTRDI